MTGRDDRGSYDSYGIPIPSLNDPPGVLEPGRSPTPGKKTRTQGRPTTGVPVVDLGAFCESNPGAEDCNLSFDERTRLIQHLGVVVITAMANLRDAIQDARIDKLTAKEDNWGAFAEFLFYAMTGPLIGTAMAAIRATAKFARYAEDIQATLTNGSRAIRKVLQGSAKAHGANGHVRFLELIRENVKPMTDEIIFNAPIDLDDMALSAMVESYRNPGAHSVAAYREYLTSFLEAYDDAKMGQVGEVSARDPGGLETLFQENGPGQLGPEFRKGEIVWVKLGDQWKLGLFEDYGVKNWYSGKSKELVPVFKNGGMVWIPPDLQPFAEIQFQERTGRVPNRFDIDDPDIKTELSPGTVDLLRGGAYIDAIFLGLSPKSNP